jgi:hypothetical protein
MTAAFVPTAKQRRQVREAVAWCTPHREIARRLRIDVRTLHRHFAAELEPPQLTLQEARARIHLAYLDGLYRRAMAGSAPAQIEYLRRTGNAPARPPLRVVAHD